MLVLLLIQDISGNFPPEISEIFLAYSPRFECALTLHFGCGLDAEGMWCNLRNSHMPVMLRSFH